jgi:hypothetical protein
LALVEISGLNGMMEYWNNGIMAMYTDKGNLDRRELLLTRLRSGG